MGSWSRDTTASTSSLQDSSSSMAVADIPDDDLAGLQLQCNQRTDDSLESTRRMMNMCAEAKDAGIKSLVALDDQGEQLDKVEAGLDSINNDMGLAEKALKSMDLAFGIFPKFWKKSEGFKEDKEVWGEDHQRRPRGGDGGQHAADRRHGGQPQEHGQRHGLRDQPAERSAGQGQQEGGVRPVPRQDGQ